MANSISRPDPPPFRYSFEAAAPIWTDFMLRARKLARYHDMQPFTPPAGVVPVHLDRDSNLPADDTCPDDYDAYFIDGTIPAATCGHPVGASRNFLEKMFGIGKHPENGSSSDYPADCTNDEGCARTHYRHDIDGCRDTKQRGGEAEEKGLLAPVFRRRWEQRAG